MAGLKSIELPHSRMKLSVAKILSQEGYIGTVETIGNAPKQLLKIGIRYHDDEPVLLGVKRMSKPGLRSYVNKSNIPIVVGGMGIAIVSTPQGVMTGKDAKAKGIGGELLCTVW